MRHAWNAGERDAGGDVKVCHARACKQVPGWEWMKEIMEGKREESLRIRIGIGCAQTELTEHGPEGLVWSEAWKRSS